MNRFTFHVPAKLNLHLQVLGTREDGYHELWTVLQSIDLADEMEIEDRPGEGVTLTVEPADAVPGDESNLVLVAARALGRFTGADCGAAIRLRKRIPIGSGLGGGSANAAATLLGLCRLWRIDLTLPVLTKLASEIGSDVPFFLHGGLALGRGRGDRITPMPDLPTLGVLVALPPLQIATSTAFEELDRRLTSRGPDATVEAFTAAHRQDGAGGIPWRSLVNDFEPVVSQRWPQVERAVRAVRATQPLHCAVTGTGAAVFGLYSDLTSAQRVGQEIGPEYLVHVGSTLGRREYHRLTGWRENQEGDRSWR